MGLPGAFTYVCKKLPLMNFDFRNSELAWEETEVSTLSDYEIERGKPMPSLIHSRTARRFNKLLTPYENEYDILPELSLKLSSGEGVPDLCIYPKLTYDFENDVVKMSNPPITTIEILSPKQPLEDVLKKIRDVYFPGGVQSAWVVLPSLKTIHLMVPGRRNEAFSAGKMIDPVTGIEVEIEEVFK